MNWILAVLMRNPYPDDYPDDYSSGTPVTLEGLFFTVLIVVIIYGLFKIPYRKVYWAIEDCWSNVKWYLATITLCAVLWGLFCLLMLSNPSRETRGWALNTPEPPGFSAAAKHGTKSVGRRIIRY
jgi:hypothetical protein